MLRAHERIGLTLAAAALIAVAGDARGADLLQLNGTATQVVNSSPARAPSRIVLATEPFSSSASCQIIGGSCTLPGDCCSQTCSNGACINANGLLGCRADSDVCTSGADCCTGQCALAQGASSGTCVPLSSFGAGTCTIDGEPCTSSDACCSRLCADIPGGGKACQADSGCHLLGNLCDSDSTCCGGAGTGSLGAGNVTCSLVVGSNPSVGTCSNPNGCDPQGDVCGILSGRHDCCGCPAPSVNCCKDDGSGVFRCHGGGTLQCPNGYDASDPACCVAAGQVCTFSHECCGGTPCLPDGTGVLRCAAASSSAGGLCTTSADCSNGLQCITAPGSLGGTCKDPDLIFANGFQ